jgi:hypothetical protein
MFDAGQRGDDKARVGLAAGPLGLADDAARLAPAVQRRPRQILEPARRLAGPFVELLRLLQFGGDGGGEALVPGLAEQVIDPVQLAPAQQGLAGKPRISPQQDAHPRPA